MSSEKEGVCFRLYTQTTQCNCIFRCQRSWVIQKWPITDVCINQRFLTLFEANKNPRPQYRWNDEGINVIMPITLHFKFKWTVIAVKCCVCGGGCVCNPNPSLSLLLMSWLLLRWLCFEQALRRALKWWTEARAMSDPLTSAQHHVFPLSQQSLK